MNTNKKHLPSFSDFIGRTVRNIREANPFLLIMKILLIILCSLAIVWNIAAQTKFSPMHSILLCLYLSVVNCLVFLPSRPLPGSDAWFFRLSFFAVYIGAVLMIWDELKWIYTGADEEAIRNYTDLTAWLVYWGAAALIYVLIRRIVTAVYHASAVVSGFVKRFADGVRKAGLIQNIAAAVIAVGTPLVLVYYFSRKIPLFFTHEYWLWLLPAMILCSLLLPAKRLTASAFWFFRIAFFLMYCGVMIRVLISLYSLFLTYDRQQLFAYSEYPYWAAGWIIPAAVYGLIRFVFNKLCEKDNKIGRALRNMGVLWSPFLKTEKKEKHRGALLRSTIFTLLFLIVLVLTVTGFYLMYHFPNMDIEAVVFTVRFANNNFSSEVLTSTLLIAGGVLIAGVTFFIMAYRRERASVLRKQDLKKTVTLECETNQITLLNKLLPIIVLGITGCCILAYTLNLREFLRYRLHPSTLYEDHYVEPSPDIIHFPEDKKNLVFIFMESYENTYTSKKNGGNQTTDYMPELVKMADDNLFFSNREGRGGQSVFFPTVAYTMASSVAQTSGIPLTTAAGNPRQRLLSEPEYTNILSSVIRLEDILHDAGYNQLFATGSDSTFGGYNTYVAQYDNDELFDANVAKKGNYLSREPKGPWGVEDCLLFPVVKDKVRELAKKDAPFAVTAYTIDTHSYEHGFRCENCDPSIKDDFAASVECSNRIVSEFVHWLENEPYGDDTVVIVVGDHLADIRAKQLRWSDDGYVRTTYNCFVHAQKTPVNRYNRTFTTVDMFPTTLSALGVTIDGDRLGLGTDLFSATPTLCEEMGKDEFVEQVQMRSYYYNAHFWQPIDLPRNVYNSHT